ncbi:DUF4157 domain-containing protein [Elioraea sp.]|uniref:eCIS core domain-containing protein n=1 Tax=Elioraea sp. TaxID=2185103 RepID=UPI0025B85994|nr:DUF4157 domain-containing protein [Elioraea sp.]
MARATDAPMQASPVAVGFRIGATNDHAEAEADSVADRVLAAPTLRRRCAACEQEETLSRSADGGAVSPRAAASVNAALSRPGETLAAADAAFFGERMGHDLSAVRVHSDGAAARAAQSVGARAFALGDHLVFGHGEYRPATGEGRRLLAHELAHVAQARGVLRREPPAGGKEPEKAKEKPDVIIESLKIVAAEAAKQEKVKKKIIEPAKQEAERRWDQLSPTEQAAVTSFGAGTYLLGVGAMLGDPAGRKTLSGLNLLAPTELIPGWPLTSFAYKLPEAKDGPLTFKLGFDGTRLLDALRPEDSTWPITSLSIDAGWSVDPTGENWTLTALKAKVGIIPGLSVTGGLGQGPFMTGPFPIRSPDGEMMTPMRSLPEPVGPKDTRPNLGVLVTIDLAKLVPGVFGGGEERKP